LLLERVVKCQKDARAGQALFLAEIVEDTGRRAAVKLFAGVLSAKSIRTNGKKYPTEWRTAKSVFAIYGKK
jgi:hypothetical protein